MAGPVTVCESEVVKANYWASIFRTVFRIANKAFGF